jgi:hypothetical protein
VSDLRLDTLITLRNPHGDNVESVILVPRGKYHVTVGVGDPLPQGVSSVSVNGKVAISEFRSTASHPFKQATVTVHTGSA